MNNTQIKEWVAEQPNVFRERLQRQILIARKSREFAEASLIGRWGHLENHEDAREMAKTHLFGGLTAAGHDVDRIDPDKLNDYLDELEREA